MTVLTVEQGQVDASSPSELKEQGSKALAAGDVKRAIHLYTFGIDLILRKKETIKASDEAAEWFALDAASDGVLHALLSNRSLALLKSGDAQGAADDAEHCCMARPDFVKGHLRLLAALDASGAPLQQRRRVCVRGVRACPGNKDLREALAAIDAEASTEETGAGASTSMDALDEASQIAATRVIADDVDDPRRAMAAGDLGAALAVGAYGLQKDVVDAERYLRIGVEGGDVTSQRNLALLLLESNRADEAAKLFREAANRGDEVAAHHLAKLGEEASKKKEEAILKLRAMASAGDERAKQMLTNLEMEALTAAA